ncbi:UPF0058 family protein [Halomarina halobia]|uniref:UPF0058 family protein n=1 Tax=Halomarina halobia TaxID=3033386 RepID=A0ABD6A6X3_9EURY|nr:UPF0058 family protein [Halomarina sp. PSR21]
MRKRELIHYHALLDRIARYMHVRGDLAEDALDEYRNLDVTPAAVYRSKGDHEEAVTTLVDQLAAAAERTLDRDGRKRTDDRRASVHSS